MTNPIVCCDAHRAEWAATQRQAEQRAREAEKLRQEDAQRKREKRE